MAVVVPIAQEALARRQLAGYGEIRLVIQPANRGTGLGILLPLAHVLKADPRARVVVAPCDHYVAHPAPLATAILAAAERTGLAPLMLVGI